MATNRKILKVFLASPGDLANERVVVKQIVERFNNRWADHFGIQIELVGWEDTVSRMGRPQAIINQDLDQCEFFIGMMWKHWGSPPAADGKYSSGFEEEFERSVESYAKIGRPEMSLFFKAIDGESLNQPTESLQKVLAFKKRIAESRKILFQEFTSPADFEEKIDRCITKYVQIVRLDEQQQDEKRGGTPEGAEPTGSAEAERYTPLSIEGARFLRSFITKTEQDRETAPILPEEVARFRLLTSLVRVAGNDESTLGVHDANILFGKRDDIEFGQRELSGLIDSALTHFSNEVIPLWHWYTRADAEQSGYLTFIAFIGSQNERIGALDALRFLQAPLNSAMLGEGDPIDLRDIVLRSFFAEGAPERVRVAALLYLAVCGEQSDLPVVRQEFDKGNYQTVGPATQALVRINLRQNRDAALQAVLELQLESVDADLVTQLFAKPDGIATSVLLQTAAHRNASVRKTGVALLAKREALPTDLAEKLLDDTEAEVRYWALRFLTETGREYSDQKAREILVKPNKTSGVGLFGAQLPDTEGEKQYDRYVKERLRKLDVNSLERREAAESIFEQDARLALDFKKFATRSDALRASVDDRFKSEFDKRATEIKDRVGSDSDTMKRINSLEEYLRKQFTRKALDLLCEKSEASDIGRIRNALKDNFTEFNEYDLAYMKRHGVWEDIPLLVALSERRGGGTTLAVWDLFGSRNVKAIADTIHAIARGRVADLLALKMPDNLRAQLLAGATDKEIASVSEDETIKHLKSENDKVRRAMAIKAIRCLPKIRVKALLRKYLSQDEQRYYNAIYWLDTGISLPKSVVIRGTAQVLAKD